MKQTSIPTSGSRGSPAWDGKQTVCFKGRNTQVGGSGQFKKIKNSAILHAALFFMLGGTDRDEALEALIRAYGTRFPFFSFGLKLMLDGFRCFARECDAQSRERRAVLESIAIQPDPSHPFLSIKFSRRW